MYKVRTLMVDDSPEFLEAARRFLGTDPQVEVVGWARWGSEAVYKVTDLQPDLVLMDLALPDLNGFEATRQIKATPGAPRVIALTLHDNPEYRTRAEAAGADGFVAKADFGVELLPLIRALFPSPEPEAD